jgi:spermidine/putrescine transport system substrate-binding protein
MTNLNNPLDQGVSRRRFLQGTGLIGVSAFLAACSTSGTATQAPTSAPSTAPESMAPESMAPESMAPTPEPSPAAELNFANWPLYIDTDDNDPTKHASLEAFTAKYGTVVNYSEVINDNEEFFGTIKAPLQAGQDTGWDLITLTQWMAARLVRLGWLEQFDKSVMPNYVANLEDAYVGPDFDPNNDYHAPWQGGMTGLGYDKAVTGELTSIDALFNDKWAGKITYLTEMRDSVGLTLLKLGYEPETVTDVQYTDAINTMQQSVDDGIVRSFTGNEYAEDLVSGNVVLAMAWSGDIIQKQGDLATLEFTVPDEGAMLWYDNLLIPKGAAHKYTAELYINFYYQPDIAAEVEAWVNYICPVKGAKDVMLTIDPDLANSPLIFPPPDVVAKLHSFRSLDESEESRYNDQFSTLIGL